MKLGDAKTVWHVLDLDGEDTHEEWWCFDTKPEADDQAATMARPQVTRGRAVATDAGSYLFWAVKRPRRKSPRGSALLPSPSTPTPRGEPEGARLAG